MKIRALTSFSGLDFNAAAGTEINVPAEIAEDLIRAGYAVSAENTAKSPRKAKKEE